ncbi:MAG: antibiotic biosynthesis monooxygenase [Bacteroidetes bacterium]|nr:antibiotic biosynthesis monooxygenase [Bacteroidota bacterium]
MKINSLPVIPYYAVIFTSLKTSMDHEGYAAMADKMFSLAAIQPGFLCVETARESMGITVSYWESEEAIFHWKENLEHLMAQELGIEKWYEYYIVRVCKVERQYSFQKENGLHTIKE